MKRIVTLKQLVTALALLALVLPGAVGAQALGSHGTILKPQGNPLVPGQYIVVFNDGVRAANQVGRFASAYNAQVSRVYQRVLNGAVMKMDARAAEAMARDPQVAFIEQDSIISLKNAGNQANPPSWGIDRIDERNLPLDNNYQFDFMGSGVDIYIVDTGIRVTHNDFGGRASIAFDAVGDGQNGNDCNGHGTHVSGTAASSTYGVAKGASLFAVRVLDCGGSGTNSGVIAGVDFVANNHSGPSVANMSLGGGASTALDNAVNNAVNSGVFFAVAAGNENQNASNVSPARAANAFTVASSTSSDARSSFSNFGSAVQLFAPGSSITSTWNTSNNATNTISGTSMASPHVAGAAALVLEEHPTWNPTQVRNELIARATSGVISGTNGSPNLLLFTLGGGAPPPPPPPPPPGACTLDDDFENGVAGWSNSGLSTCSTGAYVIGAPTQQSTSGVITQVGADHTSGGSLAIFTASNSSVGNADVDRGNCVLDSPTWNVANASTLSVWYFHGQRDTGDDPNGDFFLLQVSTNGGASYNNVVSIGDVRTVASWTNATFPVPAGSSVRLRLQVSDGSGPGDIIEGGIDDLSICDN